MIRHQNKKNIVPFDTKKRPPAQNLLFMIFIWPLLWLITRGSRLRIHRTGMRGLKPPFLVFGSHQSFYDFYVTPLALFPHRANYISELEGFEAYGEWKYRQIGCLGTRKFVSDIDLVKNIKWCMEQGRIVVIYPEARYANVGTDSPIPESVGKLCKMLDVPVVTINMKGNYLKQPIWNTRNRHGVKLAADLKLCCSAAEVRSLTAAEIQRKIEKYLTYNEYEYQKEAGIMIKDPFRAEGLHKPLYHCPVCGRENRMGSEGARLYCRACGSEWTLREDGALERDGACTAVPEWYEWERRQVQEEIDQGKYRLDVEVRVESLPNAKNFIALGRGRLRHDPEGFHLTTKDLNTGEVLTLHWTAKECFSIHTEYDYRGEGMCVVLSTGTNSYFLFSEDQEFNPTKIQFATEYFYQI